MLWNPSEWTTVVDAANAQTHLSPDHVKKEQNDASLANKVHINPPDATIKVSVFSSQDAKHADTLTGKLNLEDLLEAENV